MGAFLFPRSSDRQTSDAHALLAGARLYFYESGTTTPLTVYTDSDLLVPHPHPIEANGFGEWPAVYIPPGLFRFVMLDSEGVSLGIDFDGIIAPDEPGADELTVSSFVETLLPAVDAAAFAATLSINAYIYNNILQLASAAAVRTALDVAQLGIFPIVTKTDDATLALTDRGKTVEMNKATANVLTIPTNAAVAFPTGTVINVVQIGAGATTIQADTGVTLNGVLAGGGAITQQFAGVSLRKRGADDWGVVGSHAVIT